MCLFSRYVSQKKFSELEGMLFDGAILLFSHQETASGVNRLNLNFNITFLSQGGPCQVVRRDADTGWGWPRRSKVPETLKVSWPANSNQYMCHLSKPPIVQAVPTYSWGQCGQALVPVHLPQVVQQGELNSWTSKVRRKPLWLLIMKYTPFFTPEEIVVKYPFERFPGTSV